MLRYVLFVSIFVSCTQGALIPSPASDAQPQVSGGDAGGGEASGDRDATSAVDTPNGSSLYFATCQQFLDHNPGAGDGEVTLYVRNDPALPWTAHCADMAGTPKEFLPLPRTGGDVNFAQYTRPANAEGTHVRTHYTKLRVKPELLQVEIADQTFASSTGTLTLQKDNGVLEVTSMPFGVAAGCGAGKNEVFEGAAVIDLRSTPFKVADTFVAGGFRADGDASFSNGDQTVEILGDGYCGWMAPVETRYNPVNQRGGTLQLAHIDE